MNFDVVVATRNRASALSLTLPLLVNQSRLPKQIIIVDSSSDPGPVERAVASVAQSTDVPFRFVHVTEASSSRQRNFGLEYVTSEVTFFPDDDSVCYPGTTEALMRVYESDVEGQVAGVCARPVSAPPNPAMLEDSYEMSPAHKRVASRSGLFRRAERAIGEVNPMVHLANRLQATRPEIAWLEEEDCVCVPWMTGFRMSFRTELIRRAQFEPAFHGYAMFEDFDAGFSAGRGRALVATHRARIYHHRFPTGRPDRFAFGVYSVLNRAFVLAKQADLQGFPAGEKDRLAARLRHFIALRNLHLRINMRRDRGAREELRGTLAALARVREIFAARGPDRADAYAAAAQLLLPRSSVAREASRRRRQEA